MNSFYALLLICALLFLGTSCRYKEKRETELSIAAAQGNYNKVVQISGENGIDINDHVTGVDPPLCIASYAGHKEIVEFLISKGANVNIRGEDGSTPLLEATVGHQTEIVRYLLSKGADRSLGFVDKEGNDLGVTALNVQNWGQAFDSSGYSPLPSDFFGNGLYDSNLGPVRAATATTSSVGGGYPCDCN